MIKMTPREALYNIIVALGPVPRTNRNDNLTPDEVRLRDSVRTLQNFITYHDDSKRDIPSTQLDWVDDSASPRRVRKEQRGDGKDRIDTWREECNPK